MSGADPCTHIKYDHGVSRFEVDTETTSSGREKEGKIRRTRSIEVLN